MPISDIHDKPGYQIRRLRQIGAAIFASESAAFDITGQQWTMLRGIDEFSSVEQTVLGDALSFDRATTATLLARLEEKGLVRRTKSASDRRRKHVALTPRGRRLIVAMEPIAARVQELILAPLAPADRQRFSEMLKILVDAHSATDYALTESRQEAS